MPASERNLTPVMARITHRVVARFPYHELAIERLARSSESFRAMCEEYNDGIEALERWRQHAARQRAELDELGGLLADLEMEILAAIEGDAAGSGQRRQANGR